MFCAWFEASERDGNFELTREYTGERVLAEIIGNGGDFSVGGEIFQRYASIRPDNLRVIGVDCKDGSGYTNRRGGSRYG